MLLKKYLSLNVIIIQITDNKVLSAAMLKIPKLSVLLPRQRRRCRGKMQQLISGWSVTDGISLSASEAKWSAALWYLLILKLELLCL